MQQSVCISAITLENIKNVTYGHIDLLASKHIGGANLIGIYGQNGSGKTVLIEALDILKHLLLGERIPNEYVNWIAVNQDKGKLQFEIQSSNENGIETFFYEVVLKREEVDASGEHIDTNEKNYRIVVDSENLSYKKTGEYAIRKTMLMNSGTEEVLLPKQILPIFFSRYEEKKIDLLVTKLFVRRDSRSFLFSKELKNRVLDYDSEDGKLTQLALYQRVYSFLLNFAQKGLFIVKTSHSALHGLNILPLEIHGGANKAHPVGIGTITIPLYSSIVLPNTIVEHIRHVIKMMNVVLEKIVPELTIGMEELSSELTDDGDMGKKISLVSYKSEVAIPLRNESEGIRKIISIMSLLIAVYNTHSIVVAIDELDSGIFEYLLGELLSILSSRGKGQLIFTSHNLRPLETLHKSCIVVTTTEPKKRYVRLTYVKTINNVRDFYYRDIILGEQPLDVYQRTDNEKIAFALRKAGVE